ncbi:MAG: hypothetical protein IT427_12220 [Pirellulales bacterium]|nr:hypothetical protein [Pirellulales bacterium]
MGGYQREATVDACCGCRIPEAAIARQQAGEAAFAVLAFQLLKQSHYNRN